MSEDFEDLGDVVECFAEDDPLTVRRPGPIVDVNGRPRTSGPDVAVLGVIGSTWPVAGRRLQKFIEGGRVREPIDIFTTPNSNNLQALNDLTQTSADIITVDGDDYEVVEAHKWKRGQFGHFIGSLIRRAKSV